MPPQAAPAPGVSAVPLGSHGTGTSAVPSIDPQLAGAARQIQIGDCLNSIFEVRRFIARGGMGEVFEGVNVNTDERVAIKVILPHLAADEQVQAMFRKEARTLTRLSHPGLVQYRVLAQEPNLGVLYIVTDYIDGTNLSDQLASLDASTEDMIGLLCKLSEGLGAAHNLGAIHRDISPDNVMLEGNSLERAKVIDFGIAKDLDAAGQTIVGDGFAGKLNYVAPEQLGDFNRNVGPWTDVYSLALTLLAVATGKDVKMGATLVEAVDKRRAGVDVSEAPAELQPVLQKMLQPDPKDRPQSMEEVLHLLGEATGRQFTASGRSVPPGPMPGGAQGNWFDQNKGLVIGGGVIALLAVLGLVFFTGGDDAATAGAGAGGPVAEGPPPPPPENPLQAANETIEGMVHDIPCSWLDTSQVNADGNQISLSLRGVSGRSASAMDSIEQALRRVGLEAPVIDFSDVSPIPANFCRPVEVFDDIRAEGSQRLSVKQRKFEMSVLPGNAGADAGKLGAQAVFTLDLGGLEEDMTLIGLNESGEMIQFAPNKDVILQNVEALGNDSYRFTLNTTHSGWSGILMLTGQGPFPGELLTSDGGNRSSNWADQFETLAERRGWKSEMVWYRTVDEVAN
nr:serine/threonine-protein kinase [Novosphingobium marinum]